MAFFSVVLPTKSRPQLVGEAIQSVLDQSFRDFELIVSDNWNDDETPSVLERFEDERLRIVKPPTPLNMPDHWEFASRQATGSYVLFLTDRMLMRPDALRVIHEELQRAGQPEVCVWRMQTYWERTGTLYPLHFHGIRGAVRTLPTQKIIEEFVRSNIWRLLPLSMNSCVRRDYIDRLRERFGVLYAPTSPDYTSAFFFLGFTPELLYIDRALLLQRGMTQGNTRWLRNEDFLRSLAPHDPYSHVPVKAALIWSLCVNDYLVTKERAGAEYPDVPIDWDVYFRLCKNEIRSLEGLVPREKIAPVWKEWKRAAREHGLDADALYKHRARRSTLGRIIRTPVHNAKLLAHAVKDGLLGRRYPTALDAARKTSAVVYERQPGADHQPWPP